MVRSRMTRRAVALPALAAVATLLLAGCSPNQEVGQSGSSAKPPPPPPPVTIGEAFVYPTDLEVPGLNGQRILSSTGSQARWAYLPGEQPFNVELAAIVAQQLDHQAATRELTYFPEAHDRSADLLDRGCVLGSTSLPAREILDDPSLALQGSETQLAITCEPVLASGTTFGERVRFVRGSSTDVASDWVEVLYTDTATGEVAKGKELIQPAALPILLDALYDGLRLQRPMSGDQVLAPTPETLEDLGSSLYNVGFTDKGDVVVSVTGDFTSVIAAGDPNYQPKSESLVIPAQRSQELLTPLGHAISEAKAADAPWEGPAPVPAGKQFVDCNLVPCVAVTYDDGPSYLTPTVLDAYADQPYAAATFFVLGQNIAGNEEILERAAAEGHEIANHSWSHPAFTALTDEAIAQEISETNAKVLEVSGQEVRFMRPPYGDMNDRSRAATAMPAILWTVDTNDWQQPGAEAIINQSVWDAQVDGIVLMHDIHDTTVAVAQDIVDGLLERGFTLVTISQLFGNNVPDGTSFFWEIEDIRAARG